MIFGKFIHLVNSSCLVVRVTPSSYVMLHLQPSPLTAMAGVNVQQENTLAAEIPTAKRR